MIGLDRNVTVMEGNSATLCVDFNYKFATNFSINVVLTNQTFDDPGKSVHLVMLVRLPMRNYFLKWT